MDLQVLSTTTWTVHLLTGSQEVRGFESLRLHPKALVTALCDGPLHLQYIVDPSIANKKANKAVG